jgi:hypothetical protein
MNILDKIVITVPLDFLWSEDGKVRATKGNYLNSKDIRELLKINLVQFVIADVGHKLEWLKIEDCYKLFKNEFSNHIIENPLAIDLPSLKGEYGYLASSWSGEFKTSIVLMEKFH